MLTPPVEEAVASWQEPPAVIVVLPPQVRRKLILGAAAATVILLGLALWMRSINLFLAAVVIVVGVFSVLKRQKQPEEQLDVQLTTRAVSIGKRVYPLEDLAGFWLQQDEDDGALVVTIEHKKPMLIPPTFSYANTDEEDARQTLTAILPELEPRRTQFLDKYSRYFRI